MRFLANENVPLTVVEALRAAGHDVTWVRTDAPGSTDEQVFARGVADSRLLLTIDKDFGELAFATTLPAPPGVLLLRFALTSPARIAEMTVAAVAARSDWQGHLSVIEEGRIRMTPLPARP